MDQRDLAELLAAAAAPPYPHELRREDAAVTAFRLARLEASRPVSPPAGHRRPRRAVLARVLTLKAAAAGLVVAVGVGGVSLAASTGVLPNPLRDGNRPPVATAGPLSGPGHTGGGGSSASGGRSPDGTVSTATATPRAGSHP